MAGFNEMLEGATKTIGDWASELSSSQVIRNIIPTSESFGKELSDYINSNQKIKTQFIQGELQGAIHNYTEPFLSKAGLNADEITETHRQIDKILNNSDYSEEAIEKISGIMKENNIDDAAFEKIKKASVNDIQDILKKQTNAVDKASLVEGMKHPKTYASTYFNNPDKDIKKQRIAAVAGTYVGVNAGARFLSGGNLTHDEYGQKDIAGIPFI